MAIESDARRFITEAIFLDAGISAIENECSLFSLKDNKKYHSLRTSLVGLIGKINSVANIEGKGRDDLSIDILIAAEGLSKRISANHSICIKILADKIKNSFANMRMIFKKYEQNIEIVDPQLKNNPELVDGLIKFENS